MRSTCSAMPRQASAPVSRPSFSRTSACGARRTADLGWPELRRQVGGLAAAFRRMGVQPRRPRLRVSAQRAADRRGVPGVRQPGRDLVGVFARHGPGGGARPVPPDRTQRAAGLRRLVYGGVAHDRRALLVEILAELPSVRHAVLWRNLGRNADPARLAGPAQAHDFAPLIAGRRRLRARSGCPSTIRCGSSIPAARPGLPKPIVHSHGGVMLEALKMGGLHNNLGRSAETGDRYLWISSTGWIMWKSQVGALLGGTTVGMFDGSPSGRQGQRRLGHAVALRRGCGRARSSAPARRSMRVA